MGGKIKKSVSKTTKKKEWGGKKKKKEWAERREKRKEIKEPIEVDTIYFGGGTPSIVSEKNIKKVLEKIKQLFNIVEKLEITIEINPGTISESKLRMYYELGINRISIGLQSTNDKILNIKR